MLERISSGTVGLNEVILQAAVWEIPSRGVGGSGIRAYHSRYMFEAFSPFKSVLKKTFWHDANWRHAPYESKLTLFKKVIGLS